VPIKALRTWPVMQTKRNRIHFRVGDSGHEVRGARAAGRKGYANFAADARHSFRREHRALLRGG